MITIKSVNLVGETTISQLFKDQLQSLNENHFLHIDGIQYEEEEDEECVTTTTWKFPTHRALRVFIEQIFIAALPREVCHCSGDDTFFDYSPALIEETESFFKSLTEALSSKELNETATYKGQENFDEYYQAGLLFDSIQMAIVIINAILKANHDLGEDGESTRFFDLDEFSLPDYR